MWETIKTHKLLIGGIVAVVFVFVLIFGSSSSSTATATPTTGTATDPSIAANEYLAQLSAQVQGQGIAASQDVTNQQTAAAVTGAQINSTTTDMANTLAAQVAEFETAANATTTQNHDTLSAGVATNAQNNQTAQIGLITNALVANQQTQAQVSMAYINSLPTLVGEQAAAQVGVAQASRPCSSYIFGLISSC